MMQKTIKSGKPGEIFYKAIGNIEVLQIIEITEGYSSGSYKDENANTIRCWDFTNEKEINLDSRSVFAERFYWDMGNKYIEKTIGFNDRRAHIISRLFEEPNEF